MKRNTNELTTQARTLLDPSSAALSRFPLERARQARFTLDRIDKDPHFLAMMSHEIRTPMNSLLGMLELLSQTALTQEQHNMLRVSRDSAKTLARVADDILGESKIGTGRIALKFVAADIGQLIIDLVALLRADSRRRHLVIRYELDPILAPVLLTDPIRLRQILLNLASNALKFTQRGEIVLQVEAHNIGTVVDAPAADNPESGVDRGEGNADMRQKVIIRVKDSGKGMSADMLAHAWEPFAQGLNVSANAQGGTGLGLTIARQLARRLGGELTMESIPERGTTACLAIVLRRPAHNSLARPPLQGARSGAFERVRCEVRHAGTFSAAFMQASAQRTQNIQDTRPRQRKTNDVLMLASSERERCRPKGPLRILVADDHPASRLVLHRQLAQLGHHADIVENGAVGLARLRQQRYDVLLTDFRMPEMDGYALVRAWRQLEAAGVLPMPVIGLSANPRGNPFPHTLAVAMDDCLVKPITLEQLNASLQKVSTPARAGWASHVIDFARCQDDTPLTSAIDLNRLACSFGGSDAVHHILHAFVTATVEDLAILRPFMGKADPIRGHCRKRVHRVVGGLQVLGNLALAEEGAALELRLSQRRGDPQPRHRACRAGCGPHCHTAHTVASKLPTETLGALRYAIRQFCIKVTLHIDWLRRQLTVIRP